MNKLALIQRHTVLQDTEEFGAEDKLLKSHLKFAVFYLYTGLKALGAQASGLLPRYSFTQDKFP